MTRVAERLVRFERLVSPEAADFLEKRSNLLEDLESELEGGKDLPMVIDMPTLLELGMTGEPSDQESEKKDARDLERKDETRGDPGEKERDIVKTSGPGPKIVVERFKEPGTAAKSEIGTGAAQVMDRITGSVSRYIKGRSKTLSQPASLHRHSAVSRNRPVAAEYEAEVDVLYDPTEHMGSHGNVEDFRSLFQDRYRTLRSIILAQYGELAGPQNIADLRGSEDNVRIIGMVSDVRTTKNGHTMIFLEDTSGGIKTLISKKKRDLHLRRVVKDEVIGIIGKYKHGEGRGGSIIFANDLFKVDIPGVHNRRVSEAKGLLAAFTSDIHIGSRMYLDDEWRKMVKWLRGERDASLSASEGGRVKYLVVAGDLVDGIGTYPDQEKDLLIPDIYKQYEALAESLSMIPPHVEIILMPGNHDAVRIAEPQPPLPKDIRELFSGNSIHFLSNPCHFSISGVNVSAYHGKSIDDLVTLFKDVTYEDPINGMREMLRFRHFSPTYGMRNQLAPEEKDTLIIRDVPDIFVSGHVHRFGYGDYHGVTMIEGSSWQSQTPFQKMMNLKPQPAKMALTELDGSGPTQTWELT